MSNLRDWKRNPDKSAMWVEGVYPGEFEPQAPNQPRGYSRLYFSWMFPCTDGESAKIAAERYIQRKYGATTVRFLSNRQLLSRNQFYGVFIRKDK
jgi:hypothetical protein